MLPFLRFARALTLLRTARLGGVLSSTLRGSRSAGRLLSGRLGWLGVVTAVVVMGASQLLFVAESFTDYGRALHGAALATVTGEPLAADGAVARVLEVVLAIYSVVVFATLAGALGAFFLQNVAPGQRPAESVATDDESQDGDATAPRRSVLLAGLVSVAAACGVEEPGDPLIAGGDSLRGRSDAGTQQGRLAFRPPPPGRMTGETGMVTVQGTTGRRRRGPTSPAPATASAPCAWCCYFMVLVGGQSGR